MAQRAKRLAGQAWRPEFNPWVPHVCRQRTDPTELSSAMHCDTCSRTPCAYTAINMI